MSINEQIIESIKNRKVIQFLYDGRLRVIEPFTLGYHKDTGKLSLSGYRVGGYSKSRKDPPWRLYTVSKIRSLIVTEQEARSSRDKYVVNDSRMKNIISQV